MHRILVMNTFEVLSILVGVATAGILFATYRAIIRYTEETKRIATFTAEQAASLPRPLLRVLSRSDTTAEAVTAEVSDSLHGMTTIQVQNAGDALAINISLEVALSNGATNTQTIAALPSGEIYDTGISRNALARPARVVLTYESVGGQRMVTRTSIEGGRWLRNVRFERRPPP